MALCGVFRSSLPPCMKPVQLYNTHDCPSRQANKVRLVYVHQKLMRHVLAVTGTLRGLTRAQTAHSAHHEACSNVIQHLESHVSLVSQGAPCATNKKPCHPTSLLACCAPCRVCLKQALQGATLWQARATVMAAKHADVRPAAACAFEETQQFPPCQQHHRSGLRHPPRLLLTCSSRYTCRVFASCQTAPFSILACMYMYWHMPQPAYTAPTIHKQLWTARPMPPSMAANNTQRAAHPPGSQRAFTQTKSCFPHPQPLHTLAMAIVQKTPQAAAVSTHAF